MTFIVPIRYLKILLMAVIHLVQLKAYPANAFRLHGIGSEQIMKDYDSLKVLQGWLENLYTEARNAKAKSLLVGFSVDSFTVGMYDISGLDVEGRD